MDTPTGTFRKSYGVEVYESTKGTRIIAGLPLPYTSGINYSVHAKPGNEEDGGTPNTITLSVTKLSKEFTAMHVSLTKEAALALSLELRKLAIGV